MSRLTSEERVLESVTEELENVDIDDEEDEIPAPDPKLLKSQFRLFAKFGDTAADGATIKGRSSPKLNYSSWMQYLEVLSSSTNVNINLVKTKLAQCGPPGTNKTTVIPKSTTVDRLTDTSRYGGTHKERFDIEGKGKGKEGRVDPISDGYVRGYKHKGTYGSGARIR